MSHVRLVSVALAGLVLSTLGAAPPATQPAKTPAEMTILKQDALIRDLEERLSAETKRCSALETQLAQTQHMLATFQHYQNIPSPSPVPPSWKQGQINGMTYYLVPCDMTASNPAKTPVVTPAK